MRPSILLIGLAAVLVAGCTQSSRWEDGSHLVERLEVDASWSDRDADGFEELVSRVRGVGGPLEGSYAFDGRLGFSIHLAGSNETLRTWSVQARPRAFDGEAENQLDSRLHYVDVYPDAPAVAQEGAAEVRLELRLSENGKTFTATSAIG